MCVGLSSALWKNGESDPDARDEAGSGDWQSVDQKGYFWGKFGARHCNQRGLHGIRMQERIYEPKCTCDQNWVKFPALVLRYGVHKVFGTPHSLTHGPEYSVPAAPFSQW